MCWSSSFSLDHARLDVRFSQKNSCDPEILLTGGLIGDKHLFYPATTLTAYANAAHMPGREHTGGAMNSFCKIHECYN
jgi:hypothetical protein